MLLGAKNQSTHQLNEHAQVTLKSERKTDDLVAHQLVVKFDWTTRGAITINKKQDLIDLIEGMDLEEAQVSLGV